MWNAIGRLLFPAVHRELDNWRKAYDGCSARYCKEMDQNAALHKRLAISEQELACFRDNSAHTEKLLHEVDAYATECETRMIAAWAELKSLAYASDERIAADCKHYGKNHDEAIGEVARLRRMMAREQARVYELGFSNDKLVKQLKGRYPKPSKRPDVHFGLGEAETRAANSAHDSRYNKQTGEL